MESKMRGRGRARVLLFASILLLGLLPYGAATADSQHTAARTEISFSAPLLGTVMDAQGWVDAAGIVRVRDQSAQAAVSGDINGTADVSLNADIVPGSDCDPDDLPSCDEGDLTGWGSVQISDDTGTWNGTVAIAVSTLEAGAPDVYGKVILAGSGGNAGKSIVADISLDDDGTVAFDGSMLTMATPSFGINLHTQVCFNEVFDAYGAFISTGAIESSGAAEARFFASDGPWTYRYGVYGEATFTDEQGSLTIEFTGMAQDSAHTKVDWGHWVITGGTGEYADAYGHGKVTGYLTNFAQCGLGEGVSLQYLGQVHFN